MSSFSGFRYRPREVQWDDQTALRREFENIATGMNAVITHVNTVVREVAGNASGSASGGSTGGGDTSGSGER